MMDFLDQVTEQYKVKDQLQKIINSRRVPHAFIFTGIEGIGKFNTAIQFAKSINSKSIPNLDEAIIHRIDELQEPYIKLIMPLPRGKNETAEDSGTDKLSKEVMEEIKSELDSKIKNPFHKISIENANTIKISSIREIKKFISFTSDENIYKFVIILDAEYMNDQAQNALLKSLEEPPPGIIFILITSQKESLLPTIVSRCREIVFEPLPRDAINEILVSKFGIEKSLAKKVSYFANGSVTQAVQLIRYDFESIQQKTISILRYSFAKKYQMALSELTEFSKNHSEESLLFLIRMIKIWLNDVIKNRKSLSGFAFEEASETIEKFNARYSKVELDSLFRNLDYLESIYDKNINLNVLFLNVIFEIASVVKRN